MSEFTQGMLVGVAITLGSLVVFFLVTILRYAAQHARNKQESNRE